MNHPVLDGTRVCAALKDGQGRLTHVSTESKSGREAFAGSLIHVKLKP